MTQELVNRKRILERFEKKSKRYAGATLCTSLFFGISISPLIQTGASSFSTLLITPVPLMLLVCLIVLIGQMLNCKKKTDKKESEFETLRQECIDRLDEIMPDHLSHREKEAYLNEMEQQFSINLYFRS
nr:DUF2663 family protein [Shouchella lehensis]